MLVLEEVVGMKGEGSEMAGERRMVTICIVVGRPVLLNLVDNDWLLPMLFG